MSFGILILRLALGITMAAHGSQKLFGAFGGPGLNGTKGWLGSMNFRAPALAALAVAGAEFGGGVLVAAGLFTPFAAFAIAAAMVVAVTLVHFKNGFFNSNGGFELNFVIWGAAVAVAATGGARYSLDNAFGWAGTLSGAWWGVGVAVASVVVGLAIATLGRRRATDEADESLAAAA
jgi:putative oxidoreductase